MFPIKAINKFFLLQVFLLSCIFSFSQEYKYIEYTTADGLPSNEIYYILQDSRGYLWFTTDNGISRFDGYEFKNYNLNDGLLDNLVFSLYEDYKKRIWIISSSLELTYIENDTIKKYKYNYLLKKYSNKSNRIFNESFHVDTLDNIHFGTYAQRSIKISSTGSLFIEKHEVSFRLQDLGYCITSTCPSSEFMQYPKTLRFITKNDTIDQKVDWYSSTIYGIKSLIGHLLFTNGKVIYELNKQLEIKSKSFNRIAWLGQTKDSTLWVSCFKNGVLAVKDSITKKSSFHLLDGETVTHVFKDNTNSLWISTLDGLYFVASASIFTEKRVNKSIGKVVEGLDKELWFSDENGIIYQLKENNELLEFSSENEGFVNTLIYLPNDRVLLYGGASAIGVIKNKERIPYNKLMKSLRGDELGFIKDNHVYFKDLYLSENDKIFYIGYAFGSLDYKKKQINELCFSSPNDRLLLDLNAQSDSVLIITTKDGLWKYKNNKIKQLAIENPLLNDNLRKSQSDEEGNLWVATKSNGLLYLHKDSVYQILEKDGLSSNSINTICIDSNIVWVGTMHGLNKITINNLENRSFAIERIFKEHGLAGNVINDIRDVGDMLYVATDNGLSYFNISDFTLNRQAPPIYITSIKIQEKDTTVLSSYELEYNQNNIAIEFLGLNYRTGDKTWYKYRLVGADQEWTLTQTRTVRYSSLQPGEYQFEVHAQNENGVWSSEPAHVFLLIQKPFWERWWFVLLIFLLVLGGIVLIVAFFFRVKFKESQKRNQLHNNLNRLKQEALAQQMNPHFIFNSLGSIQYYINENDIKASNKYLTMFSNLMRMTLNNSHKKNVSIHEEIKALEMYIQLEQLRFSDKFEYRIYIDPAIDTNKYIMPSLMLQPFVENAIWHGIMHKSTNDGLIEVRLTKQGLLLEYLIRDNGIGRRKSSEINAQKRKSHQSLGSKITESRLQLISSLYGDALSIEYKDLKDLNKENCGTEVRITLPILSVK